MISTQEWTLRSSVNLKSQVGSLQDSFDLDPLIMLIWRAPEYLYVFIFYVSIISESVYRPMLNSGEVKRIS